MNVLNDQHQVVKIHPSKQLSAIGIHDEFYCYNCRITICFNNPYEHYLNVYIRGSNLYPSDVWQCIPKRSLKCIDSILKMQEALE